MSDFFPNDFPTNEPFPNVTGDESELEQRDQRGDYISSLSDSPGSSKRLPFITGEFNIMWRPGERPFHHGKRITVRIYSTQVSLSTGKGKLSDQIHLKYRRNEENLEVYKVKLYIEENFGDPGAFVIENNHNHSFFLVSATISAIGSKDIYFDCRSWVYPFSKTQRYRIFFANTCYLPGATPIGLKELRREELDSLKGPGSYGERKEWDRVYEYDCYDDLGLEDGNRNQIRPKLGGVDLPYPRRIKTGHLPTKSGNIVTSSESQQASTIFDMYVPPDERISSNKQSELMSNIIKATIHFIVPVSKSSESFKSFEEILDMFSKFTEEERKEQEQAAAPSRERQNKLKEMEEMIMERMDKISPIRLAKVANSEIRKCKKKKEVEKSAKNILRMVIPRQYTKEIIRLSHQSRENFLKPQIIIEDEEAWMDDTEFARQMLAGTNPTRIRCLEEKEIDKDKEILERADLEGLQLHQAKDSIFILDHYGYLMPSLLNKINSTGIHAYASRTFLFKTEDDTLKPIAIQLGLPSSINENKYRVFYPPERQDTATSSKDKALWQLAKAHVASNDCVYHQLISHWLHTHAVIEPFIIATRRCLSVMHPIHRLLDPHFRDTMHINALARAIVLNAGGIFERILFTGKFSMELSSALYKEWRFEQQALPEDLKKRGVAKDSETHPAGVELIFDDYPYAADGLEIWIAIRTWVKRFCSFFYKDDNDVKSDEELKSWWWEVRNKGHPDIKEGWYNLETLSHLHKALTTIIWMASGLHASVNFGQYAYAGYPPNRPTQCRKPIPEEGSSELDKLLEDPDRYLLDMLPRKFEAALGISLMYVLSSHASGEVYLGQVPSKNWINNEGIRKKFDEFRKQLVKIAEEILGKNRATKFLNRWGPAKIPYKLLCPDTSEIGSAKGVTGRGIPNNISI